MGESPKTLYWLLPHAALVVLTSFAIKDTFSWPAGMLFPLLVAGFASYVFIIVVVGLYSILGKTSGKLFHKN
jgi:hypothetical protein